VKVPPLAAGRYGLRYKVLAADGHVTESVLRFTVESEKPARPAQPAQPAQKE
jgi:methionine-rich copper-binding protein CopC